VCFLSHIQYPPSWSYRCHADQFIPLTWQVWTLIAHLFFFPFLLATSCFLLCTLLTIPMSAVPLKPYLPSLLPHFVSSSGLFLLLLVTLNTLFLYTLKLYFFCSSSPGLPRQNFLCSSSLGLPVFSSLFCPSIYLSLLLFFLWPFFFPLFISPLLNSNLSKF